MLGKTRKDYRNDLMKMQSPEIDKPEDQKPTDSDEDIQLSKPHMRSFSRELSNKAKKHLSHQLGPDINELLVGTEVTIAGATVVGTNYGLYIMHDEKEFVRALKGTEDEATPVVTMVSDKLKRVFVLLDNENLYSVDAHTVTLLPKVGDTIKELRVMKNGMLMALTTKGGNVLIDGVWNGDSLKDSKLIDKI